MVFEEERIYNKILPSDGVGIEFDDNGTRCVTVPRPKHDLHVSVNVTTWTGMCAEATHYYASLSVGAVPYKKIGGKPGELIISNIQPRESRFDRIDVVYRAEEDIFTNVDFNKELVARKGEYTSRFTSIESCLEAVESMFEVIFGEPWVLQHSCYAETWEESKRELLKEYGGTHDRA